MNLRLTRRALFVARPTTEKTRRGVRTRSVLLALRRDANGCQPPGVRVAHLFQRAGNLRFHLLLNE
jgi:hypothetical protein